MMNDASTPGAEIRPPGNPTAKLRAALDYLGDKLSTHPASRFRPPKRPLLEEWLAMRRSAQYAAPLGADSTAEVGHSAPYATAESAARGPARLVRDRQVAGDPRTPVRDTANGVAKVVAMKVATVMHGTGS